MVGQAPIAMNASDTQDAFTELATSPGLAIAKKAGVAFSVTRT